LDNVICIDLGWTIEDESLSHIDRVNQINMVCKEFGLTIDAADFTRCQILAGSRGDSSTYKSAITSYGFSKSIESKIQSSVKWNTEHLRLFPGVKNTLRKLATENTLVLLANQSKPVTKRLINYQIHEYFQLLVCSCEVGYEKPDPRIFKIVTEKYKDSNYWMIGDRTDNDIKPANNLNWKTIRVRQGNHKEYVPQGHDERPDYTIDNFEEVLKILG
jgi:HAD superfamily hydrolase (TIGR01549 family)